MFEHMEGTVTIYQLRKEAGNSLFYRSSERTSIAHFHFGIDCEFLLFELPSLWGFILETLEN